MLHPFTFVAQGCGFLCYITPIVLVLWGAGIMGSDTTWTGELGQVVCWHQSIASEDGASSEFLWHVPMEAPMTPAAWLPMSLCWSSGAKTREVPPGSQHRPTQAAKTHMYLTYTLKFMLHDQLVSKTKYVLIISFRLKTNNQNVDRLGAFQLTGKRIFLHIHKNNNFLLMFNLWLCLLGLLSLVWKVINF